MSWRTYLVMYFGDNVSTIRDIVEKVEALGFESNIGTADFIYDWHDEAPTKEKIFKLGDKLKRALKGTGAIFNLDSHD